MQGFRPPRAVRTAQYLSAVVVGVVALVGLLGWFADLPALTGRVGVFDAMVPATALSLLALSTALIVRLARPGARLAVRVLALAVAVAALLEVVDLVARIPVAPGRLFSTDVQMTVGRQFGRMSPLVAASLIALAGALVLSYSSRSMRRSAAAWLAVGVGNLGFVLCVAYVYGSPLLFETAPLPPAIPAALSLLLLGAATAALIADRWPLAMFVGDSVRAQLMRAMFPVIVGISAGFALLDVADHRLALTMNPIFTSLAFVLAVAAVSVAVLRTASQVGGRLDHAEDARNDALNQLEVGNAKLEAMVRDVTESMGRIVEARDPYTQGHERRVATIARLFAEEMGLSDDEVEGIEIAGLLHDIGKLRVPAEILTKPGRLSDLEYALVKEHPKQGYEILKDIAFPWPVADMVLQHHERADGSGYPAGLLLAETVRGARILAVADVLESMASHRPYRAALGVDRALREFDENAERYDPEVVACCRALRASGRLLL